MSGFKFNEENILEIEKLIKKYPKNKEKSAIKEILYLAQAQNNGYISKEIIDEVGNILSLAPIRVYEIATFYTMFNLEPVGKYFIQICTTTPCWLRGSDKIVKTCKEKLGVKEKTITDDGLFSYNEVECLGACVNAPMVQINNDYYEDLTEESMSKLIENLRDGNKVTTGSQIGRQASDVLKENI